MKGIEHVRPVQPLLFPASKPEWELPESNVHSIQCALLADICDHELGDVHAVGADQFVYWDASNPEICLAPDVFVKLDVPWEPLSSWKTWEKGTPELAIEILASDTVEYLPFKKKLQRYRALGVGELVVYEMDHRRIRAWDRVSDDLVERKITTGTTPCVTLDAHFVLAPGRRLPIALRLARDPAGAQLLPTPEEAERAAKEAERAAKEEAMREVERLRALLK